MALNPIYQGDGFSIEVTILQADNTPLDLTGATLTTGAEIAGTKIAGTATATSLTGGVATVTWAPGLLTAGNASLQLRVAYGSTEAQTVWSDSLKINASAI